MSRRSKQNNPQTLQPDLQTQFKGVDIPVPIVIAPSFIKSTSRNLPEENTL